MIKVVKSLMCHNFLTSKQTEALEAHTLFRRAEKKNNSISREAKKAIGILFDEQLDVTLLFLGAGGQVKTSGILNLLAFGVEHPLEQTSSSLSFSTVFISWAVEVELKLEPQGLAIVSFRFLCHLTRVLVQAGNISSTASYMGPRATLSQRLVEEIESQFA